MQEAKASSEIENIVTTQDELFQARAFPENPSSPAAKEVARYADALRTAFWNSRLEPPNVADIVALRLATESPHLHLIDETLA